MIIDPSCRRNAIRNIVLAGVSVTATSSSVAANNHAGSHSYLDVVILPAVLLVLFAANYFAKKKDYQEHGAKHEALAPLAEF